MAENKFQEPRLALNRIYTRPGDEGQTSLVGGQHVLKDDLRIEAYGSDELNAHVGVRDKVTVETQRVRSSISGGICGSTAACREGAGCAVHERPDDQAQQPEMPTA